MSVRGLVSVVIPAYNASQFIGEALESVRMQTWKELEIIVVDDGSTDTTREVIQKHSETDKRIKYIFQPNQGCSSAKNTGLRHVTGEFIQYLDADDILSSDKIETQVVAIKDDPSAVAVCKTVVFQTSDNLNTGAEVDTQYLYSTGDTFGFLLNLYGASNNRPGMVQPNAFLIHTSLAEKTGPWNESISPSPDEDGEYFCRVILHASRIAFTGGINYYRKIPSVNSLSKGKSLAFAKGSLRSLHCKKQHMLAVRNDEVTRKVIADHYALCAYLYGRSYPEIISEVESHIKELGIPRIPPVGGATFRKIATVVGFKNAMIMVGWMSKVSGSKT